MVAMLVGYENGIEAREVFANRRQALRDLPPADTRVDQHARALSSQKGGVAGTARGENTDFKNKGLRLWLLADCFSFGLSYQNKLKVDCLRMGFKYWCF